MFFLLSLVHSTMCHSIFIESYFTKNKMNKSLHAFVLNASVGAWNLFHWAADMCNWRHKSILRIELFSLLKEFYIIRSECTLCKEKWKILELNHGIGNVLKFTQKLLWMHYSHINDLEDRKTIYFFLATKLLKFMYTTHSKHSLHSEIGYQNKFVNFSSENLFSIEIVLHIFCI